VPLLFPARVHLTLADGRVATEEVDLPVGCFASATALEALREKVRSESRPTLGENGAALLFERGLGLGEGTLGDFVDVARSLRT
jgi:hypothetical protein